MIDGSAAARLNAWAEDLRAARTPDPVVAACLAARAAQFTGEALGLEGAMIDRLIHGAPVALPVKRWGGDLGWPSEIRKTSWARLLARRGIADVSPELGMLLRLQVVASQWLPHPDAPASWAVADMSQFHRYVLADVGVDAAMAQEAYALALQWRADNANALHDRLASRLGETGIEFSARYHAYGGAQYLDVAVVVPRAESGVLRIRSVWRGESALAELVRTIYPDVVRQYMAPWLGMQRIDVFVPSALLAFEYHGEQHYSPVAFFGGEDHLLDTQARDEKKRRACAAAGVRLVEWPYTRRIHADVLRSTLAAMGVVAPAVTEG